MLRMIAYRVTDEAKNFVSLLSPKQTVQGAGIVY